MHRYNLYSVCRTQAQLNVRAAGFSGGSGGAGFGAGAGGAGFGGGVGGGVGVAPQAAAASGAWVAQQTLTPEERAAWMGDKFEKRMIPELPPPAAVC